MTSAILTVTFPEDTPEEDVQVELSRLAKLLDTDIRYYGYEFDGCVTSYRKSYAGDTARRTWTANSEGTGTTECGIGEVEDRWTVDNGRVVDDED